MITWLTEKGEDVREETDSAEVVVLKPHIEPIITHLMRGAAARRGSGVLWLLLRSVNRAPVVSSIVRVCMEQTVVQ